MGLSSNDPEGGGYVVGNGGMHCFTQVGVNRKDSEGGGYIRKWRETNGSK